MPTERLEFPHCAQTPDCVCPEIAAIPRKSTHRKLHGAMLQSLAKAVSRGRCTSHYYLMIEMPMMIMMTTTTTMTMMMMMMMMTHVFTLLVGPADEGQHCQGEDGHQHCYISEQDMP